MADVLVLGTVALDDIETPFKKGSNLLGGSATYASYAASFFAKPAIISVVGKDMPEHYLEMLRARGVDLKGVDVADKTFRWQGYYEFDMNVAKTVRTELNCLQEFEAKVPQDYKNIKYVFLANVDPDIQISVLKEIKNPELVVIDTMNFWIEHKREKLAEMMRLADIVVLNDGEARQFFGTTNLVQAGNKALKLVKKAVIIKKGEHGALLFTHDKHFNAPAYPLENVFDPTGCGDSFGGAFIGYLAKVKKFDDAELRKAVVYGSVVASFTAEDFSINRLMKVSNEDIEKRFKVMREIREF